MGPEVGEFSAELTHAKDPGHGTRNVREDLGPEVGEFSAELAHARDPGHGTRNVREVFWGVVSVLQSEICNVLCTSHCIEFMMFPLSWDRSLGRCF